MSFRSFIFCAVARLVSPSAPSLPPLISSDSTDVAENPTKRSRVLIDLTESPEKPIASAFTSTLPVASSSRLSRRSRTANSTFDLSDLPTTTIQSSTTIAANRSSEGGTSSSSRSSVRPSSVTPPTVNDPFRPTYASVWPTPSQQATNGQSPPIRRIASMKRDFNQSLGQAVTNTTAKASNHVQQHPMHAVTNNLLTAPPTSSSSETKMRIIENARQIHRSRDREDYRRNQELAMSVQREWERKQAGKPLPKGMPLTLPAGLNSSRHSNSSAFMTMPADYYNILLNQKTGSSSSSSSTNLLTTLSSVNDEADVPEAEAQKQLERLFDHFDVKIPPEKRLPTPREMVIQLKDYQRVGLTWMTRMETSTAHRGGILSDEMGLGKVCIFFTFRMVKLKWIVL